MPACWLLVAACARTGNLVGVHAVEPTCPRGVRTVDSATAVQQARRAIAGANQQLDPTSIQIVSDHGIEVGLVISMIVTVPPAIGGGGLVWIDTETGCAIVLRRYE